MSLIILDRVDLSKLREGLFKKGWKEGTFNQKYALIKEHENYTWVFIPEKYSFLSLPKEDDSRIHSEGVKALKREIKDLANIVGFSLFLKLGGSYA